MTDFSLAELIIVAASEAWRGNGEILASGIGVLPRLGASLAKLTHTPELMMTDGEAFLTEDPIPLGPRGDYVPKFSNWMTYGRVFDVVWSGRRHAMTGPTQIDRWGQSNLSCLGPDYKKPKVQMLGVRGLPGNSMNHINSHFVPAHSKRVFVEGEVDMVSSIGYKMDRYPEGANTSSVDLRLIVTDLCIMDFGGPERAIQVRFLHPGITFEQVQEATGFPLLRSPQMTTTPEPTAEQLAIIARLDPNNLRAQQLKGNPPGRR